MGKIAASWVISPVLGAALAAIFLLFIKLRILLVEDKLAAAQRWVPILMAIMAAAFGAYMSMKGLKKIWKASPSEVLSVSAIIFILTYLISRPYIQKRIKGMEDDKKAIYSLFDAPLIMGAALLSFAHGANDVANAVAPLAAIVSTINNVSGISSSVTIPLWVMAVGAFGIAFGLGLFGPKLISVVGEKITRLNSPRAFCVALSAAITF